MVSISSLNIPLKLFRRVKLAKLLPFSSSMVLGNLPTRIRLQNPVLFDERLHLMRTWTDVRGHKSHVPSKQDFQKGSIAVTDDMLHICVFSAEPWLATAWTNETLQKAEFSVEETDTGQFLIINHDSSLYMPQSRGAMSIRIKTPKATELLNLILQKIGKEKQEPSEVIPPLEPESKEQPDEALPPRSRARRPGALPTALRSQNLLIFDECLNISRTWESVEGPQAHPAQKREDTLGNIALLEDRFQIMDEEGKFWLRVSWIEPQLRQIRFSVQQEFDRRNNDHVEDLVMSYYSAIFFPNTTSQITVRIRTEKAEDMFNLISRKVKQHVSPKVE